MDQGAVPLRTTRRRRSGAGRRLLLRPLRPAPASRDTPASTRRCSRGERSARARRRRPLLELGEISGLVEACGRIEVHESGFRAERARPAVLLVGRTWSARPPPRGRACGPTAIVRRCSRSGAPRSWSNTASDGAGRLIRNPWRSCSSPSKPPGSRMKRVGRGGPRPRHHLLRSLRVEHGASSHGLGQVVFVGFFGLLCVLWYGLWAAVVIAIAGAIFFGWGDEPAVEGAGESGAGLGRPLEMPGRRSRASETAGPTSSTCRSSAISHSGKDLARATRRSAPYRRADRRFPWRG